MKQVISIKPYRNTIIDLLGSKPSLNIEKNQKKNHISTFSKINTVKSQKINQRFSIKKNIIEANKQNLEKSKKQKQKEKQNKKIHLEPIRQYTLNLNHLAVKVNCSEFDSLNKFTSNIHPFSPTKQISSVKKHRATRSSNDMFDLTDANKQNKQLKHLLQKNKIPGNQCLLGLNIPQIQEKYSFSRFQLFQLYTDFSTLINFSHNSVQDLKKGLLTILYMNKVAIKPEILEKFFPKLFKDITFKNFIDFYGNLQNLLFTDGIVQYLIGVFGNFHREEKISYNQFLEAFKDKIQLDEAFEIRKIIWSSLNRKQTEFFFLKQILDVCEFNMDVCRNLQTAIKKKM